LTIKHNNIAVSSHDQLHFVNISGGKTIKHEEEKKLNNSSEELA
jgi:hypothetical protein